MEKSQKSLNRSTHENEGSTNIENGYSDRFGPVRTINQQNCLWKTTVKRVHDNENEGSTKIENGYSDRFGAVRNFNKTVDGKQQSRDRKMAKSDM